MVVLEFLSRLRTDLLDNIFYYITYFGDLYALLPLLCIIYWCLNKQLGQKMLCSFFISGGIVHGLKIAFRIERPWIINPDFKPVDAAFKTAGGYSFPSGHSQAASSVYLTIFRDTGNKILRILCTIITILVIFSRMYLGVHTPLDVFFSLIISLIVIHIIFIICRNYSISSSGKLGLLILSLFYSCGVIFYSYLLVRWNISTLDDVASTIVFVCGLIGFSMGIYLENKYINFRTQCRSGFMQILKLILGFLGIAVIFVICSFIPANECILDSALSLVVAFWVTFLYPCMIKVIFQKKSYSEL